MLVCKINTPTFFSIDIDYLLEIQSHLSQLNLLKKLVTDLGGFFPRTAKKLTPEHMLSHGNMQVEGTI